MGEYYYIVNLDKKEYVAIVPVKFVEWLANENSKVLFWLCTALTEGSGKYETLGRWAGDRVVVIGDYNPDYNKVMKGCRNITYDVVREILDYAESVGIRELAEFMKDWLDFHHKFIAKWMLKDFI